MSETPDPDLLARIELVAAELAAIGGAECRSTLGTMLSVTYKGDPSLLKDPVSEVDGRVEAMIRLRLAETFPDHDIIGEEIDERPGRGHDWVWAVDPIDGTTNFVNGFPLFASSVGVLYKGRPVAGALWCSTSHRLSAGVYHAREGDRLRFDGEAVLPPVKTGVRRRLAGEPEASAGAAEWEVRKTGSAALECGLVAAGLLEVARFATPNLWDVAAGVVLVRASGGDVLERTEAGWTSLDSFASPGGDPLTWRRPLAIGPADAVRRLVGIG